MKIKTLLLLFFVSFSASSVLAHALWIETSPEGKQGKEHTILVRYGEYASDEYEDCADWYSDVASFKLWLSAPDGTKKQLSYAQGDKAFTSSFVPEMAGQYIITITHSARDFDGTMVYQFNASAVVSISGKSFAYPKSVTAANELHLQPEPDTDSSTKTITAFYKGKPAAGITITVTGPSGWSKNFKTNEQGLLVFKPLWKGTYGLEGFYTSDEKGDHFDKPYESIWRCATLRIFF